MANVLLSLLKDKSTIYRLGGDEYYILLEGITLKNEIESFLGEVISEIENNNYLEGTRNHITTSMGIVSFPVRMDKKIQRRMSLHKTTK